MPPALSVTLAAGQLGQRRFQLLGHQVIERFMLAPPLQLRAASTLSGVIGIDRTCTPMALATAVPMAPGIGTDRRLAQRVDAHVAVFAPDDRDDLRHVDRAGDLVHVHVRVHHRAGLAIEDAVLEQREADALDHRAADLVLDRVAIDRQADVLQGDDLLHADDARLDVDQHFGKLHGLAFGRLLLELAVLVGR